MREAVDMQLTKHLVVHHACAPCEPVRAYSPQSKGLPPTRVGGGMGMGVPGVIYIQDPMGAKKKRGGGAPT
jgi:hypothetical protein